MLTLDELLDTIIERETTDGLLDLIDPTIEEMVEAFADLIKQKQDSLVEYYEEVDV